MGKLEVRKMENKNKNALSVGLCLSLVVALLFNVYAMANQEASAVTQWITVFSNSGSFTPSASAIDSNGNIDVAMQASATVLQFSGVSPYPLLKSVTIGLGCTAINRGIYVDSPNAHVFVGCNNQMVMLDMASLGVLNSTGQNTCCNGFYVNNNVLYGSGSATLVYAWFISGSNIIKCGTNVGQCPAGLAYSQGTGTGSPCQNINGLYPDFTNGVVYIDCHTPAPVDSIFRNNINTLANIATWNKNAGCAQCNTAQNLLAYDPTNNLIWSSETGSTLQGYSTTGVITRTITIAGATAGLADPRVIGNQIYFLDLTRQFQFQYNTNGTATSSAYFGNIITTPATNFASYSVTGSGVSIVGALDGAVKSWVILGGTGSSNTGVGGNNGCPTTTTNCGDVNCNLPQNAGILLCTTGGGAVQNGGFFVSTAVNNLLIGSGLINSTNTNIKTNGVGYIMVIIALGILTAMFWLASGGDLGRIPTFVWFIATLGVLGLATGIGIIDVTFFIIGAIAVIALATARILSTLELGGFR